MSTLDVEIALQEALDSEATAARLLEYALHLRMRGERASGGNETWAQFDRDAEAFLRARLAKADDFHDAVCTGPGVPVGFTCAHPSHARLAAGTETETLIVDFIEGSDGDAVAVAEDYDERAAGTGEG